MCWFVKPTIAPKKGFGMQECFLVSGWKQEKYTEKPLIVLF